MSRVKGVSSLTRKLGRMPKEVQKGVSVELAKAAALIKITAQMKINNRTGALSQALHIKRRTRGLSYWVGYWKKGNIRNWKKAGWRAHFVEYGTKGYLPGEKRSARSSKTTTLVKRRIPARRARPFLGPAYMVTEKRILRNINRSVDRALKRASKL